nr:hypothetical protein [Tanacetum cinerariifolium]
MQHGLKKKVLLGVVDEEQLAFLVDPGVVDGQVAQNILHNAAFLTDMSSAKAAMVLNTNTYAQQNSMILSMFEQMSNHATNWDKASNEKQKFWLQSSDKNSEEPSTSNTPVKIEVPSELPKLQAKDTVIGKLKETIHSLRENVNPTKVKKDIDEIETINIELEHRQKCWLQSSDKNSEEPSTSNTPVKIEVPSELPKAKLILLLRGFYTVMLNFNAVVSRNYCWFKINAVRQS